MVNIMNSAANKHEDKKTVPLFKTSLLSVGVGLCVLLVLSLLCAGLFSGANISTALINPFAIACLVLAAFTVGLMAAKVTKAKGLTMGLLAGGVLFVSLLGMHVAIVRSGLGLFVLAKLLLVLVASGLGGIIGVNLTTRRK